MKEVSDTLEEIRDLLRADPSAAKMLLKILKSGKPLVKEANRDREN